jgi:hypothetical protein
MAGAEGHDKRAETSQTPTRTMKRTTDDDEEAGSPACAGYTTGDGLRYIGKGLATLASAGVCGVLIYITKGESGIGWFVLSLCIIW